MELVQPVAWVRMVSDISPRVFGKRRKESMAVCRNGSLMMLVLADLADVLSQVMKSRYSHDV